MNDDLVDRLNEQIALLRAQLSERERDLAEERAKAEAATTRLDAFFSTLPDLYFRVDATGRILEFRAGTASDLYGSPDAFLGKRVQDVLPPDAAARYDHAFAEALASNARVQIEYSLPLPQGEEWFETRLLAIAEREIILFIRKVTAQHRDREALRKLNAELEQRVKERTMALEISNATLRTFQALADNAPDSIVLTRRDGAQVYANAASRAMFALDPEAAEVPVQGLASLVEGTGQPVSKTSECRRSDGSTFHAQVTAFEIREAGDQPALIAYILRDITRELEAEAERVSFHQRVIEAQRAALRELATPLMPIAESVVAMPLIGTMDRDRIAQLVEVLLAGVEQHAAQMVLVDVTGVPVMDAEVAAALVRIARAVGLLGARLVLTGIRPDVARTLVSLEADLGGIATLRSLQQGIAHALGLRR